MKRTLIFLITLMISVSAHAQKRYDEITYPELNDFDKGNVEEYTLDNGITFYLVEDHELPLIRMNAIVRTGSLLEPANKAGLASITGQVMREGGSENYPADELNVLLENKSAYISTSIGFGSGSASLNLLKEDFDELLPVFVDVVRNPAFPEDKIDLAKTQAKTAISRRNDDQQAIASREFEKLIYGEDTPYAAQTEYATIDAITREDLVEFHEQAFVGNNMMIGVIGDFDTSEMKRKLREAFGSVEPGSETNLIYPEVDYSYPSTVNLIDKPDVNQSFVFAGHIGGLRENPDYAALQLLNEILSGGFSGRLLQTVRSDMGLAYSVFGNYGSNINYPGWFYVGVMTKSSTTAEAIDAMLGEVKKLQEETVPSEELNEAKDRMLNSLVFRYDSKTDILNERISNEYNGLPQDYFDQYVEDLKEVSAADVKRVANEYLKPDQVQILVVGNKEELGDQLDKYGDVNEIDITIPVPDAGEEVTGDAAQGQALLAEMANAVLPETKAFESVTIEATATQQSPMGSVDLPSTQTMNFNNYSLNAEVQAPQGTITLTVEDGSGTMGMMGQSQAMPTMMLNPLLNEMKSHYLNIALKSDEMEAEYLGTETIDGTEYPMLKIAFDTPVTFLLDPETHLPHISRRSELNPNTGSYVNAETVYSDWRNIDGIMYSFSTEGFADGEKASSTVTSSVTLNK